jgi:hypothetical protein
LPRPGGGASKSIGSPAFSLHDPQTSGAAQLENAPASMRTFKQALLESNKRAANVLTHTQLALSAVGKVRQ